MSRETLYDLRSTLALNPYHQVARLLLLENLFILHDTSFDEELRKAAIYITDRRAIFNLVEAAHYRLSNNKKESVTNKKEDKRTTELIDSFLEKQPEEETIKPKQHRRPTPIDATTDYVSYLLELERYEQEEGNGITENEDDNNRTTELIDGFINSTQQKIQLNDEPQLLPEITANNAEAEEQQEEYMTETLAHIYIKQGRYSQALEIIKRLNLNYPKKNIYFADQIRFLEKLVKNSKNK